MKKVMKIVGIILIVVIILALICFIVPLIAVFAGSHSDIEGEPSVMIVFGYKLDGGEMQSLLKCRLDTATEYLSEHPNMTVIVSGGKGDGEHMSEAQCMYDYLVAQGIDEGRILKEDASATTVENIRFCLELIEERGIDATKGILLVSNEFHLARIRMLWKRADSKYKASTLAAPSMPTSQKALMHLREPFALLFDFLSAKF